MAFPAADLTGQRFGRLTAMRRIGYRGKHALWLCRCACEREAEAMSHHLRSGSKRSCGCLVRLTNGRPQNATRNAAIRAARAEGRSYQRVAEKFGLSREMAPRICLGEGA